jgi:hypothetical protein
MDATSSNNQAVRKVALKSVRSVYLSLSSERKCRGEVVTREDKDFYSFLETY